MFKESLLENLSIYNDNLSVYYLGSVFITILSVILAWWYHNYSIKKVNSLNGIAVEKPEFDSSEPLSQEWDKIENDPDDEDEIMSKIKMGRQSLLAEKIAASMTDEQLQEEKEVEKQQLQAIFQLLQTQEDKFHVGSLQELQDQLKLYRH